MQSGFNMRWMAILATALALAWACDRDSPILAEVDYTQLNEWITTNEAIVIIDVRPQDEYNAGYIQNAINIPFETLVDQTGLLINGGAALTAAVPDQAQPIVFYCTGFGNDVIAAQRAADMGYTEVYYYAAGTNDWDTLPHYYVLPYAGFLPWYNIHYPFESGAAYVVDSLTPETYQGGEEADIPYGHIPCAVNIPVEQWADANGPINGGQAFIDVIPQKDAAIAIYCLNASCGRDLIGVHALMTMGYTNVYRYQDGLKAWLENDHPTVTGPEPCPLPPE